MRTLAVLTLFLAQAVLADEPVTNPVESVTPQDFFAEKSGDYVVHLAGGEKPHEGTDSGFVMIEDGSGLLSFSYCQPGGLCDPNDQYFPMDGVTITKTTLPGPVLSYELKLNQEGVESRFTWEENGETISLKNYQYEMANGAVITLEHQFRKKNIVETTKIGAEEFFNTFRGNYKVLLAQGLPPEKETMGLMDTYDGIGNIGMPYCHMTRTCLPNDNDFPFDATEVIATKKDGITHYDITVKEGDVSAKYTLEQRPDALIYTNYQLELLSGELIKLEQHIQKID